MGILKLIYFEGCPNADRARKLLREVGVQFEEVNQDVLPANHPHKGYASPTALDDRSIVFGAKLGDAGGGCSLDIPSAIELQKRLSALKGETKEPKSKSALLSTIGSIGSGITVGLCPICIPAIGAFLSTIGLGFLVQESVLKPILVSFLVAAVGGLLWSSLKEHRKFAPFILGALLSVALYVGRYIYIGSHINEVLEFGSIAGLVGVSIWNLRLRKTAGCSSCNNLQLGGEKR